MAALFTAEIVGCREKCKPKEKKERGAGKRFIAGVRFD